MKFGLLVPTRNAGADIHRLLDSIRAQKTKPSRFLVIDSSSEDGTADACRKAGAKVVVIPKESFDHGGTRWMGVKMLADCPVVVLMTHDAVLADPEALGRLVAAFRDPFVGAAYGRQRPRPNAGIFGAHAREFNYPETSSVKTLADAPRLGIKAAFLSDSFSAYRVSALRSVGGFRSDVVHGEDMLVAARMLRRKWKISYKADAEVFHSHEYSMTQEFRRYFDTGVMHSREPWLLEEFGGAEGEGKRFVLSEVTYLVWRAPHLLPEAFLRTVFKWLGYKAGRRERSLPVWLKRTLSMNRTYWVG